MLRLLPAILLVALAASPASAAPAHGAQSNYSMVGSPAGGDFGQAEVVWAFDRTKQTYVDIGDGKYDVSSDTPDCPGYFAYFSARTLVTLPAPSHDGDTHTCALSTGWNIVGNPFSLPALLPADLPAYTWQQADSTYATVTTIPAGGAVWIFETGPATITIQAQ